MAHCDLCCLRLSLTKAKTLPKHYSNDTYGWFSHGAQKECSAQARLGTPPTVTSTEAAGVHAAGNHVCCSRTMTLNKNGKFPKHATPSGDRCDLSDANGR